MAARIIQLIVNQYQSTCRLAVAIHELLAYGCGPPPALAVAAVCRAPVVPPGETRPSLADGLLWAVPKHRRSVERRMMRRFGADNWPTGRKLIRPRSDLVFCAVCGGHYVAGALCMTCYSKVVEETRLIQQAVADAQGLRPVDREVAVVYSGERQALDDEQTDTLQLVEVAKERPQWFSKNLVQRVTTPTAETTEVKPSDLA